MTLQVSMPDAQARLQHALDLGFRYLGQRDRTVAEVRRHLEAKRVEPDAIADALSELARQGALDDERYARLFAEDRRRLDGWGSERIRLRLERAGIDADTAAEVTDAAPQAELDAAVAVLRGRLRERPQDDRGRERALGLLVRRGYELDTAYAAVRAFESAG